jgi:hypothetical protein
LKIYFFLVFQNFKSIPLYIEFKSQNNEISLWDLTSFCPPSG